MSRCQEFPSLGFVWNGVCGNELIELLKARREKAESEKEEKRKAKRMQRKSSKRNHEEDMHKEDKKQKIEDKNRSKYQNTRKSKLQDLKNCADQLKELLENWVPPPIQSQQTEFDDLYWLFDSRGTETETPITSKFPFSHMNGICALPYTILY